MGRVFSYFVFLPTSFSVFRNMARNPDKLFSFSEMHIFWHSIPALQVFFKIYLQPDFASSGVSMKRLPKHKIWSNLIIKILCFPSFYNFY